jgi:hypothetical protein
MTTDSMQTERKYEGPMAPVYASILLGIGWLVFILLYALYWSKGFSLFQNIIQMGASKSSEGSQCLMSNRQWLLSSRSEGMIKESNFRWVES